ncbi:DUF1847 domain-containing protein [Paradesulfitobacterium ferrireducens]|uniref:DUF1847 domain-containing protein n=1 Tax=Paradesulfitobacterium ferrireducens TaxID=2816476 RepID=UPI001A8E3ACE|nr:DUF1847 domain-containing protein [Paradesulfitobacterium ferrireducens]
MTEKYKTETAKKVSGTYGCLYCRTAASFKGETNRMPKTCPTLTHETLTKDISAYEQEPLRTIMQAADKTPFTLEHVLRSRVEELIFYCHDLGLKKIGIAFCVTLMTEAQNLAKLLSEAGLDPVPVCCRVGAVDYSEIGLPKAHPDKFAAICNPVAQAELLNLAEAELVVQVGLCLGHDLILQQTCKAPVTTLVVKDRVFDHHPVRALRAGLDTEPVSGTI